MDIMLKAGYKKHVFQFITPGGTSRGVLTTKNSWYIYIYAENNPEVVGIGECSVLPKLSIDDTPDLEKMIGEVCLRINDYIDDFHVKLKDWPAIRFALEVALLDLHNGGKRIVYPSLFSNGEKSIPINGLIWMGEIEYMKFQLKQKLSQGFKCIKIKVGALNFESEISFIEALRRDFDATKVEIRVDANGAFSLDEAWEKMKRLHDLQIHSIEQPIKAGQWNEMRELCASSDLPVALDEELIGICSIEEKRRMLEIISPAYIILKPSLIGGFKSAEEWISLASEYKIRWWATSALEGNVGLNAIAQWTAVQNNDMPQGLGTGQVFSNNINSPLVVDNGALHYSNQLKWEQII